MTDTPTLNAQRSTTVSDPLWYKDAIIYQTHVKSFRDENADGYGDFRGLTERLDYIQQLGATCVWLLPFYPSPLRDDGYDISSYESIHSTYGTIEDFQGFLDAAHERGLKVFTELVINHTSDQHPWFQRARMAPKDSPERNFYVWSDDPNQDKDVRIIFQDFETSNWTWDPIALQYYWHRFFHHQPDLNYDIPVMPRMVMAIQREDRYPITDIFDQTPEIPETCQWAMFLRNHDELTLEMVTDEERDYMYRVYAKDPKAKINLGIRHRLAPLLANNRRKIELLKTLLFSMPGTPIIYYGDEIGMGDNFYLGDRNGCRTPMQWSPDRNAGFSRANPQQLYLPITIDPEYHYEAVNVENQQKNLSSLLWWMRRVIAMRKNFKAFSRGSLKFLYPDNAKVLAFLRRYENETIVVVVNLSRFAQSVELDLSRFAGSVPMEVFSRNLFRPIKKSPYVITLGPHAYYWFALQTQTDGRRVSRKRVVPVINAPAELDALIANGQRAQFERDILPDYMQTCRWFGSKARTFRNLRVIEQPIISSGADAARVWFVEVSYLDGPTEVYSIPVKIASRDAARVVS